MRTTAIASALVASAAFGGITTDRTGVTLARSGREVTQADARCFATECLGINERLGYVTDMNATGGADWYATTNALALNGYANAVSGHPKNLYPVHGGDPTSLVPLAMRDAFRADVRRLFANDGDDGSDYAWLGLADTARLVVSSNGTGSASQLSGIGIRTAHGYKGGWAFPSVTNGSYTASAYFDGIMTDVHGAANAFDTSWTNDTLTAKALDGWTCTYPEMLTNATTRCLHEDWRWALTRAYAPFQNIWTAYAESPLVINTRTRTYTSARNIEVTLTPEYGDNSWFVETVPSAQSTEDENVSATTAPFMTHLGGGSEMRNAGNLYYADVSPQANQAFYVWYWVDAEAAYTQPSHPVPSKSGYIMDFVEARPFLRDANNERVTTTSGTYHLGWNTTRAYLTTEDPPSQSSFNCDVASRMNVYCAVACKSNGTARAFSYDNMNAPHTRTLAAQDGWYDAFEASDITTPMSVPLAIAARNREHSPKLDTTVRQMTNIRRRNVMCVAYTVTGGVTNRAGFIATIDLDDPQSITNMTAVSVYPTIGEVISGYSQGWAGSGYALRVPLPEVQADGNDYTAESIRFDFITYYFGCFHGWAKNVKWSED